MGHYSFEAIEALFGLRELQANVLFTPAGQPLYDSELPPPGAAQKDSAIYRIIRFLEGHPHD